MIPCHEDDAISTEMEDADEVVKDRGVAENEAEENP